MTAQDTPLTADTRSWQDRALDAEKRIWELTVTMTEAWSREQAERERLRTRVAELEEERLGPCPDTLPCERVTGWAIAHAEEVKNRQAAEARIADARREERMRCAEIAASWQRPDAVRLAAGEMTAQELRTAQAVAGGIERALRALTDPVARSEGMFPVGSQVEKIGGDYTFTGKVVAAFQKLSGAERFVVEDDRGVLHVYSAKNLRLSPTTSHEGE